MDETEEYCAESPLGKNNWNYILGCYHGDLDETVVTDSTVFTPPEDCVLETDDPVNSSVKRMTSRKTLITAISVFLVTTVL